MFFRTYFLLITANFIFAETTFTLIQADNTIRSIQNTTNCLLAYKNKRVKVQRVQKFVNFDCNRLLSPRIYSFRIYSLARTITLRWSKNREYRIFRRKSQFQHERLSTNRFVRKANSTKLNLLTPNFLPP